MRYVAWTVVVLAGIIGVLGFVAYQDGQRNLAAISEPSFIEGREKESTYAMDSLWRSLTPQEQFDLCMDYNTKVDRAWEHFNAIAQDRILYVSWSEHMVGEC